MIETAKEKRKDKKSDAEHLKKLREQIAQDRANRKKDYETVSAEEKAQNDEKIRKIKEEKLREERERLEEQRRMRDTMARIQVDLKSSNLICAKPFQKGTNFVTTCI